MAMDFLGLFFFISSIVISLVRVTIAQPNLVQYKCSDNGYYTSNTTYQANLNSLLTSLYTNTKIDYGFYNFSFGQNTDKVNAIALCRGDLTPGTCRNCVNDSSHQLIQHCPNQKEAIGWYDTCMLRYSDRSIFGTAESSPVYVMSNPNNASDQFNQVLETLFDNLKTRAATGGSLRKFATGANSTSLETIYALVQCTPDISEAECRNCLDGSIGLFPKGSDRKEGGRVFGPSCNVRFETFPVVDDSAANMLLPSPTSTTTANLSPPRLTNTTATKGKESNRSRTIIFIIIPTVASMVLIVCICIFLRVRKPSDRVETMDEIRSVESLQFDFATIRVATDNFSDANKLGQGGFGPVYKGKLSNGQEIAVKRLFANSEQGEEEFKNEVLLVAKLQHRNLVRLLGYCFERNERLLIYEFMPNTSLNNLLFDPIKSKQLDWEIRSKIIGGITRGLLYLHEDSRFRIIHRDLKASNILLDAEMNPKISDFGMAKLFLVDQTRGDTRRIVGSYGYMAPEYAYNGNFSVKSDVYSFGVLVLEIVSGQKNGRFCIGEDEEDLKSYAWKSWMEGRASTLLDPTLTAGSRTEMMRCMHIGLLCVQENVADRPTMASVVLMLNSHSLTLPIPSRPAYFMYSSMESEMPLLEESTSGASNSDHPNINLSLC